MSNSKLDVVSKMPNREKQNMVTDYLIDISSLMLELKKSLLITDDTMYLKMIPLDSKRLISPSLYILKHT